MNPFLATDGYKVDHHRQYPEGTTLVYSNFTPRAAKHAPKGVDKEYIISFGQQMVMRQIHQMFDNYFFKKDTVALFKAGDLLEGKEERSKNLVKNQVCQEIKKEYSTYLGVDYDVSHIEALWDLGYLPIKVKALPEGTKVRIGVPVLTIVNTKPEFFWLTNFLETLISNLLWKPMTSATIAHNYRQILMSWASKTDKENVGFVDFQGHDFSMRGMDSVDATISSGLGHALSFLGSDSLPVIYGARKYYDEEGMVIAGVPATEHSVMCAGSKEGELVTFSNLLDTYKDAPILSVVSDTWNLWDVVGTGGILAKLKNKIMSRPGKLVIRPDCYSDDTSVLTNQGWKMFTELNPDKDLVAQVLEDGSYEFVKPLKYVNKYYEGDMISYKDHHGKIDLLVTPNHRMIYDKGSGGFQVQEAKDCNFFWNKNIRRSASAKNKGLQLSPMQALKIAFQADGSYTTSGNNIRFSFSKQRKIKRLESILKDCNLKYRTYNLKDDRVEFNVKVDSSGYSKDFSWVKFESLCSNWCQEFIEELSYWDATRRHAKRFKFDTTVKEVAEVVELVAMSAGYGVLVKQNSDNRKNIFSDVYTAYIMLDNKLGGQSIQREVVPYKGNVVCVKVPTGRIVVKRGSGQLICGNSGNPVDIICGLEKFNITEAFEKFVETGHSKDIYFTYDNEEYYYDHEVIQYLIEEYTVDSVYEFIGSNNKDNFKTSLGNGAYVKSSKTINVSEQKGVVELLWDIFGGTKNKQGYNVLDPHIGAIYGDSITLERANEICKRLEAKGFSSTNVVLGIGSYTYQYNTRDTFGFAMKATYVEVREWMDSTHPTNENSGKKIVGREIYKDPITDSGTKKSAKGLLKVYKDNFTNGKQGYYLRDQVSWIEEDSGELKTIFEDGEFKNKTTLTEIKNKLIQN